MSTDEARSEDILTRNTEVRGTMSPFTNETDRASGILRVVPTLLLTAAVAALAACDLGDLLSVETPGKVREDQLSDPALAQTLTRSVIGDFECAWSNYVAAAAVHSDEYVQASGNGTFKRWGLRKVSADFSNMARGSCAGWGLGIYTPLQTARFQAKENFERISEFSESEVPEKSTHLAISRVYHGWSLVALGEGFCSMAVDRGPELSPAEVLRKAEERLTEGMNRASQVGRTDLEHMARAGRARVRLDLEDFQGAIDDASQIPPGYVKVATRDGNDARRYNTLYEWINGPQWKHASVAPSYRDVTWKGEPDPRVNVTTDGSLGFDFVTTHYRHDKANSRADDVVITSHDEAQLIIAEASARTGDIDRARAIINELHAEAGIPPLQESDASTESEVVSHVLEERRRELFVQGGHRLNDMLRFRNTEFEIPFLGEPGSDHPDGDDQYGDPYGDVTCFPLPIVEKEQNPNISG